MNWIDWIEVIIFGLGITVYGLAVIIGLGHVIGLWIIDKVDDIKEHRKESRNAKIRCVNPADKESRRQG